MPFRRVFLLFLCLFLPFFASCQRGEETTALSLVRAMTALESALPAGDIYLLPDAPSLTLPQAKSTPDTAPARMRIADESLLTCLLGELGTALVRRDPNAPVTDGALRLSTAQSPCEWVVLRCAGRARTDEVAALLLDRLDLIRRQYHGTEHQPIAEQGEVVILGQFVLLIVSHDTPAAIRAARSALS